MFNFLRDFSRKGNNDRWFGGLIWCPKCQIWRLPEDCQRKTRIPGCSKCVHAHCRAYGRKWRQSEAYKSTLPQQREASRQYRLQHPKRRQEIETKSRVKSYSEERKIHHRLYLRMWRSTNPEQSREHARRRRLLKQGVSPGHTLEEWERVLEHYNRQCVDCGTSENITKDHVIPLSRGGTDSIDNVVPRCGSCNSKKGTRLVQVSA